MTKGLLLSALALSAACSDFLDVNRNPNAPEVTAPVNYLPPMIHWLATSEQFDGRFLGRYSQMWHVPSTTIGGLASTWDRHGYDPSSDNAAQLYRDVYWNLGINLSDMIRLAEAEQRWDLVGIGYTLRAWGWFKLTSMHGEIIVTEAFTPDKHRFAFDPQSVAYDEVLRLLDLAIETLQRTDGTINPAYVAQGDKLFNGNTEQWLKFAWGLKAQALNHFTNKGSYDPQAVIDAVDNSFGPGEDVLFNFPNSDPVASNDRNFWSVERGNLGSYRQSAFIAGLMDGTQYGGAVDPRISRMLAPDSTGTYRGIDPDVGYPSLTRERPWNLWGFYGTGTPPAGTRGRYLFDYRVRFPIMTYAQLQFIKAEAALHANDQATALEAYENGIRSHFAFVNARIAEVGNEEVTPISNTEIEDFLANPDIMPATLTLSHVMGQKFIAQWGWAHTEAWMDELRYHYTDMDPVSGTQVFRGFEIPTTLYPDNGGQPVQRVRPRFNSDYVWNRDELNKIGGLAIDYHTKPMWITQP